MGEVLFLKFSLSFSFNQKMLIERVQLAHKWIFKQTHVSLILGLLG